MRPDHLIVQLSDLHLTTEGILPNGARPSDNLVASLDAVEGAGIRPDVLLLTGDLTDNGEPECYRDLAGLLDGVASRTGALVVYLPGNHDDRASFCKYLIGDTVDGSDDAGSNGGSSGENTPINRVHWHGGLRIATLDTNVPGEDFGVLAKETLDFLADALTTPAPDGTLLALHHPPIPSPIEPMTRISLRDPERLAAVIAGSDVRLVVCGHNHHAAVGMLGTVPVWVSPATAYLADTTSREVFRGVPGCAMSQIEIVNGRPSVTVIEVGDTRGRPNGR